MKKYLRLGLYNLAILIFLLLLGEGMVRLFVKNINLAGTSNDIFQEERFGSTLGFLPNEEGYSFGKKIKTDEEGFLDLSCTNYDRTKKSILFIGDSVTQGVGVETDSTFVGKLSCYFQEKYNIINASLIGYDFSDYKNVVEHILSENKYEVHQVVINFCLNDIYEKKTSNSRVSPKSSLKRLFATLKNNSYLYIWLKAKMLDRSKAYFMYDFHLYKEEPQVESFQKIANEIDDICNRDSVRKSIVIFPYEFQLREKNDEYFLPQEKISKIFEVLNSPVFLPQLFLENKVQDHKDLFLFGDGIHFSKEGHQHVFDFFIQEKIIE